MRRLKENSLTLTFLGLPESKPVGASHKATGVEG
jgi:hypothetical protein